MTNLIAAALMALTGATNLFDGALGWINTDKPIHLDDLKGKVVLVDFWTYCCINCLHTLPTLAYLEEKFPNELVVVGVHSAKFETEKDTDSIREAVLRYNIKHPVANDADFKIWRRVGARAWPTILLLDPEGQPVGMASGEPDRDRLEEIIGRLVERHRESGTLDETPIVWPLAAESAPETTLRYPGKLLVDTEGGRLFVSDTSHNRILICGLDGQVQQVVGNGDAAFADGTFTTASFKHPQGMALDGNRLYAADVENHAVRVVHLDTQTVTTLAGNGAQGNAMSMAAGDESLSSPWDVTLMDGKLYVAMAGSHQIWELDKNTGEKALFAGSGRENIVDAPRLEAQLAQPSGLSVGEGWLYFADSEVSGVRRVSPGAQGKVETLIGKGLFDFGDVDGPAADALLQHCLGVAYAHGGVYIADAYNHKIKLLDLDSMTVSTVLGTGQPGDALEGDVQLREPNDVKYAGGTLYIADTNNHRILKHDLAYGETEEIVISLPKTAVEYETLAGLKVAPGEGNLELVVRLPENTKITPETPFSVEVEALGNGVKVGKFEGKTPSLRLKIPLEVIASDTLHVRIAVPYCAAEDATVCTLLLKNLALPLAVTEEGGHNVEIEVEAPVLEEVLGSGGDFLSVEN